MRRPAGSPSPTPDAIAQAADRLLRGELVAFPTETVYGLGADASNAGAVRRMFAAKGRPADHPVIVHIGESGHAPRWARDLPPAAQALAEAFWPGPLTLIVPRAAHVSDTITGGQDSVGLRVPSHPVARALLAAFAERGGQGIAAPSANRFGHVSPTTAAHVATDLGDAVGTILDGGPCDIGIESTIVAIVLGEPLLLRPGAIDALSLARVLGHAPRWATDVQAPRASGTLASHYATQTRALLVAPDALRSTVAQREARDERVAVLARTQPMPASFEGAWIAAPEHPVAYAHDLYASLRKLDDAGADSILIEAVPDVQAWAAVRDRLARATHAGDHDDRD